MLDIVNWTKSKPSRIKMVMVLNKSITTFVYAFYPLLILYLMVQKDERLLPLLLIPAVSFVLVTVLRKRLDAKRPYQIYDYEPILIKKKDGQSFPSRHVFSIFMIAMSVFVLNTMGGILFLILGSVLALSRVLGGVHFPRDVIAGALMGIIPWIIYWAL